jgi:hypothetical protein
MENSMERLHTTSKGRMLYTIEKFYMYKETKNSSQITDRHTVTPNVIFDAILHKKRYSAQGYILTRPFTHSTVSSTT